MVSRLAVYAIAFGVCNYGTVSRASVYAIHKKARLFMKNMADDSLLLDKTVFFWYV